MVFTVDGQVGGTGAELLCGDDEQERACTMGSSRGTCVEVAKVARTGVRAVARPSYDSGSSLRRDRHVQSAACCCGAISEVWFGDVR